MYLSVLGPLLWRAPAQSPLVAKEIAVEGGGQDHLSAADHAAPPTVGGDAGLGQRLEVGPVGHPDQGVEVRHELQDVGRGSLHILTGPTYEVKVQKGQGSKGQIKSGVYKILQG